MLMSTRKDHTKGLCSKRSSDFPIQQNLLAYNKSSQISIPLYTYTYLRMLELEGRGLGGRVT